MHSDKVALFGLFGGGNLGNTSTLQAIVDYIHEERPETNICCICYDPEVVAQQHGIAAYPIDIMPIQETKRAAGTTNKVLRIMRKLLVRLPTELWLWVKTVNFLRRYDVLIVPGTGILDDFGVSPFQLPYDIFKWSVAAKLSRTPLYFVSIGAGPIVHPVSRFLMISSLRLAAYRSYRDQLSKDYLDGIGFDTSGDAVYPDLVFGLSLPPQVKASVSDYPPKVIGLGIMQYYGWRNLAEQDTGIYQSYIEKITHFTAWLLEAGYVVRLIIGQSHDQIASADIQALLRVKYRSQPHKRLVAESIQSVDDLFQQLSKTDMVVATRFHNVLCSLMLNRPTISIGYARKNDVLMEEMGLGDFCQQIEELDVELLIKQFTNLVERSEQVKAQIVLKNAEYQSMLYEQYQAVFGERSFQTVPSVELGRIAKAATLE